VARNHRALTLGESAAPAAVLEIPPLMPSPHLREDLPFTQFEHFKSGVWVLDGQADIVSLLPR
jgi:hypothetical protein